MAISEQRVLGNKKECKRGGGFDHRKAATNDLYADF